MARKKTSDFLSAFGIAFEIWKKIVDAYHTPEVEASVTKLNDGNLQFKADWTAAKLQEVLTAEEAAIKKSK